MQKGDEASPSIILAGQSLLMKMIITLEKHGIFGSNFVYLCILKEYDHKDYLSFQKKEVGKTNILQQIS